MDVAVADNTVTAESASGNRVDWCKSGIQLIKSTTLNGAGDSYVLTGEEGFVRVVIIEPDGDRTLSQLIFVH